ncbi:VCBS repeat-containing protein [Sphaerisporangium sp. NPDC088356]|uniref:VCBS repeat-containing protein n=1 Tax=Sphaerisporangium sp. NPDC088356 TaxID=3154871 RepID=UPI00341FEDD9
MTWRSLLVSPLVAGLLAASLTGAAPSRADAAADCSKAGAADFDGDGRDDVAVGDPLADAAGVPGAGAVHILPADGSGGGFVVTAPDAGAGAAFGWTVRTTHVDGDGCLDVVVGAPYAETDGTAGAGAVYVIHGGAKGGRVPPKAVEKLPPPQPEVNAHFGWALAAAGPKDGPGGVIAVGAPYEDADSTGDAGAVYVYPARADIGPRTPKRVTQEGEGVVGNSEEGDMFGWSLVLGHLGGQARAADLAIGTPYENDDGVGKQGADSGKADTGAVEVIFDVAEAGETYTSVKWGIPESVKDVKEHVGDRYGYALAYAEFGGKPYLAASAPLADVAGVADSGLVQTFQADQSGKLQPARTIRLGAKGLEGRPAEAKAALGWSLAMLAAPKALYLAIGSPFDSGGGAEAGAISGVLLSGEGDALAARLDEPHAHDHLGWSVASFGATDPFAAGTGLLAGVPDERSSPGGAVAVMREGSPTRLLVPGRGGVPAVPEGSPADFGASVSG